MVTAAERAEAQSAIASVMAKEDGAGLRMYETSYVNSFLAGQTAGQVPFALVAGSHEQHFPYYGAAEWDNGLMLLEGEQYTFTQRNNGEALDIEIDPQLSRGRASIHYHGTMRRVRDGADVRVEMMLVLDAVGFEAQQLGKRYNLLDLPGIAGLRWRPFSLRGMSAGLVTVDGVATDVLAVNGQVEHGVLNNFAAKELAIAYDYVGVARAGTGGYAFVDFESRPLVNQGILGRILAFYLRETASETHTLAGNTDTAANMRQVNRPAQSDASVVLFETSVDLGMANLRRQMIRTTDASGAELFGLREIFEAKETSRSDESRTSAALTGE